MSTSLRTGKLLDNCTPSINYDSQVQSASAAFDEQMYQIIDETGQVIMIPNIMGLTDPKLVDVLAWQFNVDFYDTTRDLEFRKNLVQMSIVWHKTKGTVALVEEVLNTYWPGGATLEEWYEYSSWGLKGTTFNKNDVNASQDLFNATGHGLVNGDQVFFAAGSWPTPVPPDGTLPQPLDPSLTYYVVSATTNSFKVSTTLGGAPVDLLDAGTGNNTAAKRIEGSSFPPNYPHPGWHDRYRFRIMIDEAVIASDDEAAALKLIDRYKPVSRWLEDIIRSRVSDCNIGWAGGVLRFITLESESPDYP